MKIFNRLLITVLFLSFSSLSFAHSGRIDGNGGHRVNKPHVYDGRYIEIINGKTFYKDKVIKLRKDDYHFHVHPDKNGRKDGIYIPVNDDKVKEVTTDDIVITGCLVIASKESDVYHNPDSGYGKKMKEENVIIFANAEEAEKEGYQPSEFYKKCQ